MNILKPVFLVTRSCFKQVLVKLVLDKTRVLVSSDFFTGPELVHKMRSCCCEYIISAHRLDDLIESPFQRCSALVLRSEQAVSDRGLCIKCGSSLHVVRGGDERTLPSPSTGCKQIPAVRSVADACCTLYHLPHGREVGGALRGGR